MVREIAEIVRDAISSACPIAFQQRKSAGNARGRDIVCNDEKLRMECPDVHMQDLVSGIKQYARALEQAGGL